MKRRWSSILVPNLQRNLAHRSPLNLPSFPLEFRLIRTKDQHRVTIAMYNLRRQGAQGNSSTLAIRITAMVRETMREIVERTKRRIIVYTGLSLVGGLAWAVVASVRQPVFTASYHLAIYWFALICLAISMWEIHRSRYGTSTLLLFFGGAATVPIGIFAIIGSLSARRMWSLLRLQDMPKLSCSKCGYDMRAAPVPRCPECGCLIGFARNPEELGLNENDIRKS